MGQERSRRSTVRRRRPPRRLTSPARPDHPNHPARHAARSGPAIAAAGRSAGQYGRLHCLRLFAGAHSLSCSAVGCVSFPPLVVLTCQSQAPADRTRRADPATPDTLLATRCSTRKPVRKALVFWWAEPAARCRLRSCLLWAKPAADCRARTVLGGLCRQLAAGSAHACWWPSGTGALRQAGHALSSQKARRVCWVRVRLAWWDGAVTPALAVASRMRAVRLPEGRPGSMEGRRRRPAIKGGETAPGVAGCLHVGYRGA